MPDWLIALFKAVMDSAAITIAVAVVLKLISAVAGIFTIVWLGIQIYVAITGAPFHESPIARWVKSRHTK